MWPPVKLRGIILHTSVAHKCVPVLNRTVISTMLYIYRFVVVAALVTSALAFRKVVVQAVHKEKDVAPSLELQTRYNFSVFSYQKLDPSAPHYMSNNRATEAGVYLKYIVDHYDDFPDVAIFVHAHPHEHQPHWIEMVNCISPTATWYNINEATWIERTPDVWYVVL